MPTVDRANVTPPLRIAIIGGGLAGLSAAHALVALRGRADRPHDVTGLAGAAEITLYESRRQTGGRAGSFVDPATGNQVDYCQHVAMGCCLNLLDLLRDCRLIDDWRCVQRLDFLHPTAAPSQLDASRWLPAPLHFLPSLGRLNHLTIAQRWQIARAVWRLMRTPTASLRSLTATQWLSQQRQSPASIRDFWAVILVSALGDSCERVSMAAARKVLVDGFLSSPQAADLWIPQRPLGEIFGRGLPAELQRRGVRICIGTSVRLLSGGDRATPLMIQRHGDGVVQPCDHVIVAVPPRQLHRVIPPQLAQQAGLNGQACRQVAMSAISGIHLWFDRPITAYQQAALVGCTAQWLFRPSTTELCATGTSATGTSATGAHGYQVVISGSQSLRGLAASEVLDGVMADLHAVFPGARDAHLVDYRVVTDPHAVFSLSPECDAGRPPSATLLPRLHLAGDYVQTGWPATMEGAVISGRLAAARVADAVGLTPRAPLPGLQRQGLAKWLIRD